MENESVNVENEAEVSDAELDAAFQEFMGIEEPVEEPVKETEVVTETEVQETTIPHPESSRLGRKVARIESKMVSKEEIASINSKIDALLEKLNKKEPEYDEYGNVVQPPIKEEDIERIIDKKQMEKQQLQQAADREYQENYLESLRDFIDDIEDPLVAKEVYKKMVARDSEFNVKHSDNPYKDVAKNFARALKAVSSKRPFSGKRDSEVPTGVTTSTTNHASVKPAPKLDPEAEEFAKMTGMSVDEITEALEGDIPINLSGRKF